MSGSELEKGHLMSIQEVHAEELARFLHRHHHVLAPYFGCWNTSHAEPWTDVADCDRKQLVAAANLALMELSKEDREKCDSEQGDRRYFAKPGTAEWGC
jgi:hypothetical protein